VFAVLLCLGAGACLVLCSGPRSRIAAVALVVCSLATYQPANSAFWIVVLMALLFPDGTTGRSGWRVFADLVACQVLALLIYKYGVFSQLELKDYAAYHSALPPLGDLPAVLVENSGRYLSTLHDDWRETEAGLFFFHRCSGRVAHCLLGQAEGIEAWGDAMAAGQIGWLRNTRRVGDCRPIPWTPSAAQSTNL